MGSVQFKGGWEKNYRLREVPKMSKTFPQFPHPVENLEKHWMWFDLVKPLEQDIKSVKKYTENLEKAVVESFVEYPSLKTNFHAEECTQVKLKFLFSNDFLKPT